MIDNPKYRHNCPRCSGHQIDNRQIGRDPETGRHQHLCVHCGCRWWHYALSYAAAHPEVDPDEVTVE